MYVPGQFVFLDNKLFQVESIFFLLRASVANRVHVHEHFDATMADDIPPVVHSCTR